MIKIKPYLKVIVLFFTSYYAQAQCEVFKSEITDVQKYMLQVGQLTDSLSTAAETASYDARLSTARASEAFENVKSASRSKNLGNLQFHMRKAQRILRAVRNSAEASAYAADNAHYSCSHDMDHALGDK